MGYQSDLEIAQRCTMQPICDIARTVGIDDADIEPYGRHKAKVALSVLGQPPRGKGKLILVTAITPTPAGEGKTTTTIGLADALRRIGKDAAVALREPSLGPVFGRKGGASGGGYAAPLWKAFMEPIHEGLANGAIIDADPTSLGLVKKTVCSVSGLLATDACKDDEAHMTSEERMNKARAEISALFGKNKKEG